MLIPDLYRNTLVVGYYLSELQRFYNIELQTLMSKDIIDIQIYKYIIFVFIDINDKNYFLILRIPPSTRVISDCNRVEVGLIGYRSGTYRVKTFNPTKLNRYKNNSRSSRSFYSTNTRSLLERFSTA